MLKTCMEITVFFPILMAMQVATQGFSRLPADPAMRHSQTDCSENRNYSSASLWYFYTNLIRSGFWTLSDMNQRCFSACSCSRGFALALSSSRPQPHCSNMDGLWSWQPSEDVSQQWVVFGLIGGLFIPLMFLAMIRACFHCLKCRSHTVDKILLVSILLFPVV